MNAALQPAETRRIEPTAPYSFDQSIRFLDSFAPCAGDHACLTDGTGQDGTGHTGSGSKGTGPKGSGPQGSGPNGSDPNALLTGGYAAGSPFVAAVGPADSDGSTGALELELELEIEWLADDGDPAAVGRWVREFLSLDDDLGPLYATAGDDEAFAPVVASLYGLHHVRFSRPFEAACWAALSQRTPMAVASNRKRALVAAAGRIEERDGEEIALFPTPERVLANESAVREAVDHERKERTVLGAAEAFVTGDLAALDDDALRERLAAVWGFGPWSSEFVTLRGFGRMATVPRTERRFGEAVGDLYGLDGPADGDDLDRLASRYGPLAGYWAHYIRVWHYREHGL